MENKYQITRVGQISPKLELRPIVSSGQSKLIPHLEPFSTRTKDAATVPKLVCISIAYI